MQPPSAGLPALLFAIFVVVSTAVGAESVPPAPDGGSAPSPATSPAPSSGGVAQGDAAEMAEDTEAGPVTEGTVKVGPSPLERQWLSRLEQSVKAEERVALESTSGPFIGLFRPFATAVPQGGVLILHDREAHPDWYEVVGPLRRALPDYGWSTLAIQLPTTLDREGRAEAAARINSALGYLLQNNLYNLVLIGHGEGAALAVAHVASGARVSGVVSIGFVGDEGQIANLQLVGSPVLDLQGSEDLPAVLATAAARSASAHRSGNPAYRQQTVLGANHGFRSMEGELVGMVRGWLKRYAAGRAVPRRRWVSGGGGVSFPPRAPAAQSDGAGTTPPAEESAVRETPPVGPGEAAYDN